MRGRSYNSGRYGLRRTRYEENDSCRPLFMVLISIGTICSSIYLLLQSTKDERVEQIKTFTQSTDAWAVKNRSQFANSSFVLWGGENTKGIQLVADHEHANVADKGVDVPVFQPLEYELPGGSLDDATMIPPSTFADPQKSHLYVNATYYREDGSAVRSTMGPLSFDLTTSWTVHVATPVPDQKCRRQNGMYKGSQRCEVFGKLKGMCMQVTLDETKGWQLNRRTASEMSEQLVSTGGGRAAGPHWSIDASDAFGCDPTKNWNPVHYGREHATYIAKGAQAAMGGSPVSVGVRDSVRTYGAPQRTIHYEDVSVEIRSAADPYLSALVLTHSSTSFALSSHDAMVMGVVLLVVGLLMGLQPCYECCACYGEIKKDREFYSGLTSSKHERESPPVSQDRSSADSSRGSRVAPHLSGASEWEVEMAPVSAVTSAATSEVHGSHTLDNDSSSGSVSGGGGAGDALASGNDDLDEVHLDAIESDDSGGSGIRLRGGTPEQ